MNIENQQPFQVRPRKVPEAAISKSGIPYRTLGRTGEMVSLLGLGQ